MSAQLGIAGVPVHSRTHLPVDLRTFLEWGKSAKKTIHQRLREEQEKSLRSPHPEGNLEDRHEDLHDAELEWKRSARLCPGRKP